MRALVLFGLLSAVMAGCADHDSILHTTVTVEPGTPPLNQLRVSISNAGSGEERRFPGEPVAAIDFPATFSLVIPSSRSGSFDLVVEGLDQTMVARVAATVQFTTASAGRPVVMLLLRADGALRCGNGQLDPGEDCDDGRRFSGDGCDYLCRRDQVPPDAGPDLVSPAH